MIRWVTCERMWKEGGSLIKSGAFCHDVIGSHDELMETLEKWSGKTLMGYGPQFDLGPPRFLRDGLRGAYAKIRFENLALVIFWKNGCFFHLPFLPAKHMNHTIQFAFKIIVSHQEKQEFEDLRTKQNSLRIFMMWVPPQSKFHHLEEKTWLTC